MSLFGSLFGSAGNKINVVELKKKMDAKPKDVVYIDVRTPGEYKSYRIKGFKNIPLNQIANRIREIPKDKEVVVICQSGARSRSAIRVLTKNNYSNVTNVSGGMNAWSMHRL